MNLYSVATALRNKCYDRGVLRSYSAAFPVVSIGNITAGGNGKTPLCIFICLELLKRGARPVVLSRGYGGSHAGPLLVSSNHTAVEVGDEPLLIAAKTSCPVVIARDRRRGASFIAENQLGNCIILDDAFQHRRLKRDLDIVCIDVSTPQAITAFEQGRLLPLGRFREDRDRALRRADIVVLMQRSVSQSDPKHYSNLKKLLPPNIMVFEGRLISDGVRSLTTHAELNPQEVIAFCGIANPSGFFNSLETMGFKIARRVEFSDHHSFSVSDVLRIRGHNDNLPLVCTEKDAVKLKRFDCSNIFSLQVSLAITPADGLLTRIVEVVKE